MTQPSPIKIFAVGLVCVVIGALSTAIPLLLAGLMVVNDVPRQLAVILTFGVFAIGCEHYMSKLTKDVTFKTHLKTLGLFLGLAIAFILTSAFTVRNLCEMVLGPDSEFARAIGLVFAIVAAFYVTAVFQNLLNFNGKKGQ